MKNNLVLARREKRLKKLLNPQKDVLQILKRRKVPKSEFLIKKQQRLSLHLMRILISKDQMEKNLGRRALLTKNLPQNVS